MSQSHQKRDLPGRQGLYDPRFEHDACGIGFVVNIKGEKSYDIIDEALTILENLKHRGAESADAKSGDGAGILVQIPHQFLKRECGVLGFDLPEEGQYGVGMFFAHRYEAYRKKQIAAFEEIVREEGQTVLGWRDVPVDESLIGSIANSIRPHFLQVFIGRSKDLKTQQDFERRLYVIRKLAEKRITPESQKNGTDFYISSLSSRTVVYKGMLTSVQLRHFYLDLSDLDFVTSMAMVHSRFSTNTFPSWARAHPNRYIVHNGEINTIQGNINWLNAREGLASFPGDDELKKVLPVVDGSGSDSSMFDNCLEYLIMSGYSMPHAMMMMIPEPWERNPGMSEEKRDFYRYHNFMIEPWDGPAAICFCDGVQIGGMLDRNGLRPARYYVTNDDRVIVSSEVGVLDIPSENIKEKGRLEPGKMLLVDTEKKRIIDDDEIKHTLASAHPYKEWYRKHITDLGELVEKRGFQNSASFVPYDLREQELVFGYTREDVDKMIIPMALNAKQPVDSMGADAALPILSAEPQLLFDYFQENFAQVTNPAIDGDREKMVMSTAVMAGNVANISDPDDLGTCALYMKSPVLTNEEMAVIKSLADPNLRTVVLSMLYPAKSGAEGMEIAIESICIDAMKAIRNGANLLVLSDRGVNSRMAAIPSLLASSALHNYLIRKSVRSDVSIILESGEPREVHHFCTLIGFGITAVNPYLALDSIRELVNQGRLGDIDYETAKGNYLHAAVYGILSVMSKMGISTVHSYHGAQVFEAVGISDEVIDRYFPNTPSRIGGLTLEGIAKENAMRHGRAYALGAGGAAFSPAGAALMAGVQDHSGASAEEAEETVRQMLKMPDLPWGDNYKYRKGGQPHIVDPAAVELLQKAVRENDYSIYKQYADHVDHSSLLRLRDLLKFSYPQGGGVPIEEVEPVESIITRFHTGAMSFGAISKEAHECIAEAMNQIGSMSNTGEGGEDPARFGTITNDKIKQVSSARFGVTNDYITHADELQIKCAQGAKPGEGGHLPGTKVTPDVASMRHSTTGVSLISPPPHHDIYSIEDLSELVFDLKNANRNAAISVKLCAGAGIGTIAAGVVKAKADRLVICGYDGGTGAAPRSSIRHAGLPWEIGLAEVQQTLLLNKLRDRVRLEVDGKLMTGRDVAIAALFGAEIYDFCTAPLIALGCHMLRVCHRNTCPFGICTQDPKLRKNFRGKPEYVINLMRFIAEDLREIMSKLGFRTVDEMIGRYDCLQQTTKAPNWKAQSVDLDNLLFRPYTDSSVGHRFIAPQDHEIEKTLDMSKLIRMCRPALDEKKRIRARLRIRNTDRVTGTLLGSEITKRYGAKGLPEDTIHLGFVGSAGQSLGAFIPPGLTLELEGDANDYVGKGLSGGRIVVRPPERAKFAAEDNVIIGNVALYGATSGEAYICGRAGERFAVRNSGASAVVEGVGNHGCEYMTGGRVLVLGKTGRNFAAGMSGGIAYVYDLDPKMCNKELVRLEPLAPAPAGSAEESGKPAGSAEGSGKPAANTEESGKCTEITDESPNNDVEIGEVRAMLERHVAATGSKLGRCLLDNWEDTVRRITKIIPDAFEEMVQRIQLNEAAGMSESEARWAAFRDKYGKAGKPKPSSGKTGKAVKPAKSTAAGPKKKAAGK